MRFEVSCKCQRSSAHDEPGPFSPHLLWGAQLSREEATERVNHVTQGRLDVAGVCSTEKDNWRKVQGSGASDALDHAMCTQGCDWVELKRSVCMMGAAAG
jgi:hypothetical protein